MQLFPKTALLLSAINIVVFSLSANSQDIFHINPDSGKQYISPYIYGVNALSLSGDDMDALEKSNLKSERFGGNRATGYNWETNASNAGGDYQQSSDSWMMSSPVSTDKGPAGSIITFVTRCNDYGRYATVQLQMAGHVAADMTGTVAENEAAPSVRWKKVEFQKKSPLTLNPDVTDDVVYMDELVNLLVQKFGTANNGGVKSYCLDNEPGLWQSTHPRILSQPVTINELLQRSETLAKVIKQIDPSAEVFGFEAWGWMAMQTFSAATGWDEYESQYDWAISAYLDEMKKRSDAFGKRLLDVLSVHWYPEAKGEVRICATDSDGGESTVLARLQAPRSLWDTTYVENNWIASIGNPIKLLSRLKTSIDKYYPGTKLAINEYNYGGSKHISGGLALADVLGIFGREGVYNASLHAGFKGFFVPASMLFTNFDGNNNMYGDTSVAAISPDIANYSVYASLDSKNSKLMHIICINKKSSSSQIEMNIAGTRQYKSGIVYGFTDDSIAVVRHADIASVSGNKFSYTLPKYSALHFVLSSDDTVQLPVANFKTLDVSVVGGGKVAKSVEGKMLENGTSVTLTAIADEGWTFNGWSGSDSGKSETMTIKMDNNKTIVAQFISTIELIKNGDFSNLMADWTPSTWSEDGSSAGKALVENEVLRYEIENGGSETWNVQIFQNTIPFTKGLSYTLKFEAWADNARQINVYSANGKLNKSVDLTVSKKMFTFEFTAGTTDAAGKLSFDFGGGNLKAKGIVYIDNVSLKANIGAHAKLQNKSVAADFENYCINIGAKQKVRFLLPANECMVSLSICDLSGRTLISMPELNVRNKTIVNSLGGTKSLARGMYLVRIKTPNSLISRRAMVW